MAAALRSFLQIWSASGTVPAAANSLRAAQTPGWVAGHCMPSLQSTCLAGLATHSLVLLPETRAAGAISTPQRPAYHLQVAWQHHTLLG